MSVRSRYSSIHPPTPPTLAGKQQNSKETQNIQEKFLNLLKKLFSSHNASKIETHFDVKDLEKMLEHLKNNYPKILTALNEILNSITEIEDSQKILTQNNPLTLDHLTNATEYAKQTHGLDYNKHFNAIKDKIDPSSPSMTAPSKDPVPREITEIETDKHKITLIINDEPKGPFLMIEAYNKEIKATELLLNWNAAKNHRIIMIDEISENTNNTPTSTKVLYYALEQNKFPRQNLRQLECDPNYLLRFGISKTKEIPQEIPFTAILSRATKFLNDNTWGSNIISTHNKIILTKPKDLGGNFYAYIVTKDGKNVGIAIMEKTEDELKCRVYFGPDRFDKELDPRHLNPWQIFRKSLSIATMVANLPPTLAINTVTSYYKADNPS
jgi:hypothetical protein